MGIMALMRVLTIVRCVEKAAAAKDLGGGGRVYNEAVTFRKTHT